MTAGPIRGRYAPSPTGELHLGNASTALLAWLSIRARAGTFVMRIEDLDRNRSRPELAPLPDGCCGSKHPSLGDL